MLASPYQKGFLPTKDGHDIYWQCFGHSTGIPILFLHGGPGCGFEIDYLPLFNLNEINLITFDQRGTGQSKPLGRLEKNTTPDLISDIERLREFLNIESWIVCGHSWGTTLAVLYAQAFPTSCNSLCLAAFFGGTQADQDWTFSDIKKFFPTEISNLHALRQPHDKDLSLDEWIFKNLNSSDKNLAIETTYRLLKLEAASVQNDQKIVSYDDATSSCIEIYKMLFFYAKNKFFMNPDLMYQTGQLTTPTILVHGQFDMDCAPDQAYRLKYTFPEIELKIVPGGNHSVFEEPMFSVFKKTIEISCTKSPKR